MKPLAALLAATALAATPRTAPAAAPTDCSACPAIIAQAQTDAERATGPGLCYALLGALGELGVHRTAFDAKPRYIDLFPVIYWNISAVALGYAGQGRFKHPLALVAEMLAFADAYQVNRDRWDAAGDAEPHWKAHYRLAAEADRTFGAIGQGAASDTPEAVDSVLQSAINAHVAYDLPRAIRAGLHDPLQQDPSRDERKADYMRLDAAFADAAQPSRAELLRAVAATSSWDKRLIETVGADWMGQLIADKTARVIAMRHKAWADGAGNGPLPTGAAPQPVGDHARLEAEGRAACAAPG